MDLIAELDEKRKKLNTEAEEHKKARDKLNELTKHYATKRDALNEELKKLLQEAYACKRRRDAINQQVRNVKRQKEQIMKKYEYTKSELNKLKNKYLPKDGKSLGKLRRELQKLEFKQMTSVLTPAEEQELMTMISSIQNELRRREKILEDNEELKTAMTNFKNVEMEVDKLNERINKLTNDARKEHTRMLKLFEQVDKLRQEADEAQEEFINSKLKADEEHRKHLECVKRVRDFDKLIQGLKRKRQLTRKKLVVTEAKKEAEEIFQRLKRGEKLSTQDLLSLQKAGYL